MGITAMIPSMLKSFRHHQHTRNPAILKASWFLGQVYRIARELPLASVLSFKKWDNSYAKSLHSLSLL